MGGLVVDLLAIGQAIDPPVPIGRSMAGGIFDMPRAEQDDECGIKLGQFAGKCGPDHVSSFLEVQELLDIQRFLMS